MTTATLEIYRTESGSTYEVVGDLVRRVSGSGDSAVAAWERYESINRVPAAALRPGVRGEALEIVLTSGRRLLTSRLVMPFEVSAE